MLETLKDKVSVPKQPSTLEERIIEFVKKFAKYPPRKENNMIYIINTMLVESGRVKMSADVEDVLRQVYRMVQEHEVNHNDSLRSLLAAQNGTMGQ